MERRGTIAGNEGAGAHPAGDAEALASALERIVFLECRAEQQAAAAAAERESARRAREALAAAATREATELRRQGELEAALAATRAENAELARRLGVAEAARAAAEAARHGQGEGLSRELSAARAELEAERRAAATRARALSDAHARIADLEAAREHFFARLVAWQRACDGGTRQAFDLAEFIAELRREIVALEAARDEGRAREDALRVALDRAGMDAAALAAGVSDSKATAAEAAGAPVFESSVVSGADVSEIAAAAVSNFDEAEPATKDGTGGAGAGEFAAALAARFAAEGRLGISPADIDASFEEMRPAEGRLARRLAAELAEGPSAVRLRAAARLVEVAGRRATTALAAAAGAEVEPALRAALVEQLGRAGEPHALPRIARFLADDATEVRAAAVEACVRLAEGAEARGALRRGLADPEPKVRRRAALAAAAARGLDPGPMLAPLLLDPDRQVRRLAAAALGGTRDPGAALALFSALLDPEPTVRETAADAATRLFGGDVRALVSLPPLQRGRAVARLRAHVTSNLARLAPDGKLSPLEVPVASFVGAETADEPTAVETAPGEPAAVEATVLDEPAASGVEAGLDGTAAGAVETVLDEPAAHAVETAPGKPAAHAAEMAPLVEAPAGLGAAEPERSAAMAADAEAPAAHDPVLSLEAIASVLRASLRGGTEELLARELGCDEAALAPVLAAHLSAGRLVRRGKKLFLP